MTEFHLPGFQGLFTGHLKIPQLRPEKKRRDIQPINIPIYTYYRDGSPIVLVPLTNARKFNANQFAVVDREDWERLMDQDISPNWFLVYYGTKDQSPEKRSWNVRVALANKSPVKHTSVARLILNAAKGEAIHMADGNVLNLRRSNLVRGRKPKATKSPKE